MLKLHTFSDIILLMGQLLSTCLILGLIKLSDFLKSYSATPSLANIVLRRWLMSEI